jgi:DNA-directed RNA polymerase subunit RPC12/RpoP
MAGRPSHRRPLDSRWEEVASRDRLGRVCYARRARVGARFGALVVLRGGVGNDSVTRCACDCGSEYDYDTRALVRGKAVCCPACSYRRLGQLRRERAAGYDVFSGRSDLRSSWAHRYSGMVSRCYDPAHRAYHNYGGRGVRVCAEWLDDREAFFRHAVTLPRYDEAGLDIDREDNLRGYEPGNVRMVERKVNCRNRRNNVLFDCFGERLTLPEIHERFTPQWRSLNSLYHHLGRGRTVEQAVEHYRRTRGGV